MLWIGWNLRHETTDLCVEKNRWKIKLRHSMKIEKVKRKINTMELRNVVWEKINKINFLF